MNGHGVGKQVIGAIAIEQRRSKQRGRRVVIAAGMMFVTFGITCNFSPLFASLQEAFAAQRGAISLPILASAGCAFVAACFILLLPKPAAHAAMHAMSARPAE
jgi:hypothetical protein